ncbi:MAG: hypothetical protein ACXW3Z_01260 [Limisphaerales bacterium]
MEEFQRAWLRAGADYSGWAMSEMEKTLRLLTHEEAAREDREYWWSRTPEERLRHVEELRVKNYGEDVINQRLQRVLSVSDRPRR